MCIGESCASEIWFIVFISKSISYEKNHFYWRATRTQIISHIDVKIKMYSNSTELWPRALFQLLYRVQKHPIWYRICRMAAARRSSLSVLNKEHRLPITFLLNIFVLCRFVGTKSLILQSNRSTIIHLKY